MRYFTRHSFSEPVYLYVENYDICYFVWWIWQDLFFNEVYQCTSMIHNDFSLFICNAPETAAPLFPFSFHSASSTSRGSQSPRIQCRCARSLSYQRSITVPKISRQLLHLSSPFSRLYKHKHNTQWTRLSGTSRVRLDTCICFCISTNR